MSALRIIHRERIHHTSPRFGRNVLHDSDSRRYTYNTTGIQIRAVRHNRYVPVYQQGDVGSCTGNAAVGCLATGPFYNTLPRNRSTYRHLDEGDAVTCYSAATRIDDAPGEYPPTDTGSSGLAVAKVLQQAGMISGYQHTFTLNDALKALQQVPLICGTLWLDGMDTPNLAGLVSVTGRELGGHEYIADEYDDQRGWVGFTNSWGNWGLGGRFYMQAEDFGALLQRDGDVVAFTPVTQPAPQPEPAPQDADATLAAALRPWVAKHPLCSRGVQKAAQAWLTSKNL